MYVYCVSLCSGQQHSYTVYCHLILTILIAQQLSIYYVENTMTTQCE